MVGNFFYVLLFLEMTLARPKTTSRDVYCLIGNDITYLIADSVINNPILSCFFKWNLENPASVH